MLQNRTIGIIKASYRRNKKRRRRKSKNEQKRKEKVRMNKRGKKK
jgi:hypothetical protein